MRCQLGAESMVTVRAFASDQDAVIRNEEVVSTDDFLLDPEKPRAEKERLFMLANGMERSGVSDVLLTGQSGRWLWLWLEVSGDGSLEDLRIYVPGDNFFRTFPQVYQNNNDFLRRYLSIFSTMYQELQEEIDDIPKLLDVDTAPDALLPMFASWLGLETDEALFSPVELRRLLKIAPKLLERKGTRWAVETVVKLFVEEPVYLVERNLLTPDQLHSEQLYGQTPYDFTVMLGRKMDEKLLARLNFLIEQFKPARSRCHIVFLEDHGGLDAFTYLDVNGTMLTNAPGNLDDGQALTGTTFLQ
jgi:phage tail-like protein